MNTSKELTVFNYEKNNIRVVNQNGEPWFVAKDVCDVLELDNVSQALSRLDDDEKRDNIITNDAIGRRKFVNGVNEPSVAARKLDEDERKVVRLSVSSNHTQETFRNQTYPATVVNEPGLYSLNEQEN